MNLLAGITRCAVCGSALVYDNQHLVCNSRRQRADGWANALRARADTCEEKMPAFSGWRA
jgi:hypothetical protein